MTKEYKKHEAFGMVGFSRVSGTKRLFGNSFDVDSFMKLTISRGSKAHEHGRDWYSREEELIEVYLSPAQFAELLTSGNNYSGVPCTIRHVAGKRAPEITDEDDAKEGPEIIKKIRELGGKIAEPYEKLGAMLDELVKAKKISAKLGDEMKSTFYRSKQDLESNLPFYLAQLDESADKIIHAKKVELDAAMTHFKVQLGDIKLDELRQIASENKKKEIK